MRSSRRRHDDARRRAVAADVLTNVAAIHLQISLPSGLEHHLAADLEVVRAAEQTVLEVGERSGRLTTLAIELLLLVGAGVQRLLRVDGLELAAVGVGDQREVVTEHTVARFRIQLVAERAVPLTLVDPAARQLR